MSKPDKPDVKVRSDSEISSDNEPTPVNNKSRKTRSTKQSDRILIFNKED